MLTRPPTVGIAPPIPSPHELRQAAYNATVTEVRDTAEGLRVLRVEPDHPVPQYAAGQYVSLGLGYWEPRLPGPVDDVPESKRNKVVSRPYSISSPIIDRSWIHQTADDPAVEFYIALAETGPSEPPAVLTPRLFMTRPGDRIFMGPRIVGRYTLEPVGPHDNVLLIGTGTGEAPHNAMVVELANRGHQGYVTVLTTSRNRNDFAYEEQHRALERMWSDYRYVPLSTRQPVDGVKRHVQDVLLSSDVEALIGFELDPDRTHVFLCGNPAMVGIPEWVDDRPAFPESIGAVEILDARQFTLDRKGGPAGNVHFEEYW